MPFSFVVPGGWSDEMQIAAGLLEAMSSSFDGELPVTWTLEEYGSTIKDCFPLIGITPSFDDFVAKHEAEFKRLVSKE